MEATTVSRSFSGGAGTLHSVTLPEKHIVIPMYNGTFGKVSFPQVSVTGRMPAVIRRGPLLPSAKAAEAALTSNSGDISGKTLQPSGEKSLQNSTFPPAFETLVHEVCDETEIAEVKLKVGDFEMHMKRNVGAASAPTVAPVVSPTKAPPIPSEPMVESASDTPPVAPKKSSPVASNPFINISTSSASKLVALDASSSNAYVLISSPTVGSFRSGRTVKGKKQPLCCKEGDVIKEGQIIGYLDQFGSELPVKSDVDGEVLKVLIKDGEAVGYGDPLVAVLPSFHGIDK